MTEPPAGPPDPYGQPSYPWQDQPGGYGPPSGYGPYSQQPHGYPQPPARRPTTLGSLLGARGTDRPEARFSTALAGAGAALAIAGAYVWAIGYLAAGFGLDVDSGEDFSSSSTHGDGRRFLGFGVFLVLTLLGYALVVLRRRGPLATAGTVASALGVPATLGFLFLDISDTVRTGSFPINLDAVYLISIGIWVASYVVIPGARGRAVYLALAAVSLPTYIAIKASGDSAFRLGFSAVAGGGLADSDGPGTDTGTVATVALVFGLGYYVVAALLDRAGRRGIAIGLLLPALTTTVSGILIAADDFGQLGTGATLVVIGLLVSLYAGRYGRRFTTWFWAAAAAVGVVVMVTKLGTDRYTAIGLLLIGLGAVLAAAAHVASSALNEEPDVVDVPVPVA